MSWYKGGFESVMIASFTIVNHNDFGVKDVEVTCSSTAASGTVIDHNTRTVYVLVKPQSSKRVREFNMGLINSQAAGTDCSITDLTVVP